MTQIGFTKIKDSFLITSFTEGKTKKARLTFFPKICTQMIAGELRIPISDGEVTLDISDLKDGIYLPVLISQDKSIFKCDKIVIENGEIKPKLSAIERTILLSELYTELIGKYEKLESCCNDIYNITHTRTIF